MDDELSICKRKLALAEREVADKDEKIKRLKKCRSHLLANDYQETKPKKDGEKPSKKIKGNATHFLVHSARRIWSHTFPTHESCPQISIRL